MKGIIKGGCLFVINTSTLFRDPILDPSVKGPIRDREWTTHRYRLSELKRQKVWISPRDLFLQKFFF